MSGYAGGELRQDDPVQGTRILDLTRVLAGPWATQQLADQGADVIKVEPPGGDETRRFGPVINGHSTYFLSANRNKRSIELDLQTEAGREVLERLLARADVLIENFRPGVAERLGFGWERLQPTYPRLVYVAIHAFGADGDPQITSRPGYDIVIQAMGGTAAITGQPDGPPTKSGTSSADLTAGLLAVQAVLLALLQRERTGIGQKIVVNMLHAQASTLAYHATRYELAGELEVRRGNAHAGLVPYDVFRCADGWLAVGCGNDTIWQRLRAALHVPDHDRWRRNVDRVAHRHDVDREVRGALARLPVAQADALLTRAGVPVGPVLTPDRTLAHPAVERVPVDHAVFGRIDLLGPTLRTGTTVTDHRAPPMLGEHRDPILDELGFDAAERARLEAAGAFGEAASPTDR